MVDDLEFNHYVETHGGWSVFHGEGMSRGGYIEAPGRVVSIKRYWVHMKCYKPIHDHPIAKEHFKFVGKPKEKVTFNQWFDSKDNVKAV